MFQVWRLFKHNGRCADTFFNKLITRRVRRFSLLLYIEKETIFANLNHVYFIRQNPKSLFV